MSKLTHSYSAFKMFEQCPKRYKFQRVDRVVADSQGAASIYGNRIHEQLEKRLKDPTFTMLPAESKSYEILCQAFEQMPGTLYIEHELTLNEDLQSTGWWDQDAWLRSKLDVLVVDGDSGLIADWKTGKYRPDTGQLDLFATQAFIHYPELKKVQASFVWLKDLRLTNRCYLRAGLPRLIEDVLTRVRRIEDAVKYDNWPARPSGLCPYCPAKDICEFALRR